MNCSRLKTGLIAATLVALALAATPAASFAQNDAAGAKKIQAVIDTLHALCNERAGPWHFQLPASQGGEMPNVNDSAWPLVWPQHTWEGDNLSAWYRMRVVVPEKIGLAPCPGGPMVLEVGCDDHGEIYLNGKLAQKFDWDKGKATVFANAQPGDTIVIAVKCKNDGGTGRLMSASLRYSVLDSLRDQINNMAATLESGRVLLTMGDKLPPGASDAVLKAANSIDFSALRDPQAFTASLAAAQKALEPLAPVAKKYTTYLIGHAHIDMDWLWLWPETLQVCHDTWTQAIKFMHEFPGFYYSESQPGAYLGVEGKYPALFAKMKQAIKSGHWEIVAATWVQGDTNMASGEALSRQFLTAREYCMSRFGRWTKTLWYPDNFGHAWTVPTIAHDAGIKWFYFTRCSPGYNVFQWEGPDGSRIIGYDYGGYSWTIDPNAVRACFDLRKRQGLHEAMVVYGVGDHGGGPTRKDIETAIALRKNPLSPQIKFARTDQFFPAVAKDGVELPVVRRDLNYTFRGCYTTHSDIKAGNRRLENFLPTCESVASAANVLTGRKYNNAAFMTAWEHVCFNQFHDILCGSAIHNSYKYSLGLYDQAEQAGRKELDGGLAALAGKINTAGDGNAYMLWNRLGWTRSGVLQVGAPPESEAAIASQTDLALTGADGRKSPVQFVDMPSKEGTSPIAYFEGSVPSCGWAVDHVAEGQAKTRETVSLRDGPNEVSIDNSRLRITIDRKTGAVSSIYDKALGREVLPAGQQADVPEILWEAPHGMSAWNIGKYTKITPLTQADSVQIGAEGPLVAGVIVKHHYDKSTLTQWIGLRAGEPQVDFRLVLDWQEKGTPKLGGPMLKMAFPMDLQNPAFTCSIPFGSIERSRDGQDVPSQMWTDLTEMRSLTAPGKPVTVDLSKQFNVDVIATEQHPADGNMDGLGMSYSDAIFAGAHNGIMTFNGIPWRVGPTATGEKNAVACEGQTIPMPDDASAGGLVLFGAAAPGNASGMGTMIFTDGSKETLPVSYSDWCYGPGSGEEIAARSSYRYIPSGRTGPESRIFARSYELPKGKRLKAIVLPKVAKIRIFAITLGPRRLEEPVWGMALLDNCKYGYDAQGSTLRMTVVRSSYDPDPTPDLGTQVIRYALVPHRGGWGDDVIRRAWELNNPLVMRAEAPHAGTLPASDSLVALEPSNLVLAAVKKAEHGPGLIVRWYEAQGKATTARLRMGFDVARAELTNVTESEDRGALPVRGREVTVKTRPHSVVTVRVVPVSAK